MTDSNHAPMTEAEAAELAYGLLWMAPTDRATSVGRLASDARRTLGAAIGFERKRRGIIAARALFDKLRGNSA